MSECPETTPHADSRECLSQTLHSCVSAEERPREKLIAHGRKTLSDEELIAIFLRTGLPGCNVLELARQLKRSAGSLTALGRLEASEIAKLERGIGPAKAATLAAVFELGKRAVQEAPENRKISGPRDVYNLMAGELRYEVQEHFYVLSLNVRNEVIHRSSIACGTLTRVTLHPRDVFRDPIRHSAARIVLVHNHPSGNPSPSREDISLTERLVSAGQLLLIPVEDHVIIGTEGEERDPFYSFRQAGHLPTV